MKDAAETAKPDEPAPEGPSEPAAEPKAAEQKDTPKPIKRGSIFGSILRKDRKEAPSPVEKDEVVPAVPAKDTEAAPTSEPAEETTPKPAEATEAAPAPVSSSPKKGGFLNYLKELRHAVGFTYLINLAITNITVG